VSSGCTRRICGITTTVQCVTGVLDHAVKRIRDEVLPRYPAGRFQAFFLAHG
jgi:altronate dehydratase